MRARGLRWTARAGPLRLAAGVLGMGSRLSMSARHEITKRYAKEYRGALKKEKGRLLDELVAVTGWSRANARRAVGVRSASSQRAIP